LRQYFHDYADGFQDPTQFGKQPMLFVSPGGAESWARAFVHWDVLWWLSVSEVGYVADPKLDAEQNVVFYPLFPLMIHGLCRLGLHPIVAALLIANGSMLLVICLLYRLVVRRSGVAAARWTLACWLSFPAAFFGVVPYSESLMALFTVLAMQTLLDGKYVSTGLWCGLASALKNQGVILAGALVIPLMTGPRRIRALIGLACSGLGLLGYMAFLHNQYGDPFLYVAIQKQWRPKLGNYNPLNWLWVLLQSSVHSVYLILNQNSPRIGFYSARLLDPWLGWWILAWIPAVRKLHWGLL
jgi:Gpi18-like mannosyltransferase